jgi:hypothetical protein
LVDCKDPAGKWLNAKVIDLKETEHGTAIKVTYTDFSSKYDEWIDFDSPRILAQWEPGASVDQI